MGEFGYFGRNRGAFLLWTREAEDVDNMRKRSEPKCVCVCVCVLQPRVWPIKVESTSYEAEGGEYMEFV